MVGTSDYTIMLWFLLCACCRGLAGATKSSQGEYIL